MEERVSSAEAGTVNGARALPPRSACVLSPPPAATPTFVVATEWLEGGTRVVSVTGELDLATAPRLEEALLTLPEDAPDGVIIDLARCSFIDLRGLRVLLATRERFERSKRRLALVAGNPSLLRIFKVTRVDELFEIHPSLPVAAARNGDG